jgi:DNA primase catalytic core
MALRFADLTSVIEYVKDRVDIRKVITEDIGKPAGDNAKENYSIFCPLHDEKNSPSFNINSRMQIWKCFGACNEGGDVIKWMRIWHTVSAAEAVEILAERFNLDLGPFVRPATKEEQLQDRYQLIFSTAVQWMHTQLINHQQLYKWYKDDTGFEDTVIEQYRVGYCPSVDMLVKFLFTKIDGLSQSEVHKLELDNNIQFNNALVYPILDLAGRPARIYTKPLDPPPGASYKYLGTSNAHPLFRQDLLFGLYQQRKDVKDNGHRLIVTEGFKAAMAAQAAAVMGTNVRDEQIAAIKAIGTKHLIFCFDGDQPGYTASMRVVEDLSKYRGLQVKIAQLPIDSQCDKLVKSQGRLALEAVIANAKLPIEFFVSTKFGTTGGLSLEGKYQLLAEIAPAVSKMNPAEVDITAGYLSNILGTTAESVRIYVRDLKAADSKLANPKAEESLIYHVIVYPQNWAKMQSYLVTDQHFMYSDNQRLFNALSSAYKKHQTSISATAVADEIKILYAKDIEKLTNRLSAITTLSPDYNFEAALANVIDLWRRRNTIIQIEDLRGNMMDMASTPLDAINRFRKNSISNIDVRQNQKITPVLVADKVDQLIAERQRNVGKVIGYDFGASMPVLNQLLSGIQKQHQIVIAANQGVGKSLLALNIINPIAIDQRVPTLWVNQEMPEEDLVLRLYSVRTGINNSRMQTGAFKNKEEVALLRKARDDYYKSNLYFYKPVSGTIDEIYSVIEEFKFKHGIEIVVYDYMQLVVAGRDQRGSSREEVVSHVSNVFTNMVAGTLGLASLCIAQLNRENYKEGEVRKAENIGSSYKIAQDATDLITIAQKSQKQLEEDGPGRGNRLIDIAKRRSGPSDITLHADLEEHTNFSLRFSERLTDGEILGYTAVQGA